MENAYRISRGIVGLRTCVKVPKCVQKHIVGIRTCTIARVVSAGFLQHFEMVFFLGWWVRGLGPFFERRRVRGGRSKV